MENEAPYPKHGHISREDQMELDRLVSVSLDLSRALDGLREGPSVVLWAMREIERLRRELAEARNTIAKLRRKLAGKP